MLLGFRVANHRSLRDEQELLLLPADEEHDGYPVPSRTKPLHVAGIFGANASGKTALVDALSFMARMVSGHYDQRSDLFGEIEQIPREPFLLDPVHADEPSSFTVDLLLGGHRYTYGFGVTGTEVVEEWLYLYTPDGTEEVVFEREGQSFSYGTAETDAPELTDVLNVEHNVLLIGVLANAQPAAFRSSAAEALREVRKWFLRRLSNWGQVSPELSRTLTRIEPRLLERLSSLAASADTGIDGYEFTRNEVAERQLTLLESYGSEAADLLPGSARTGRVHFRHRGRTDTYPLDLSAESSGTRAILSLGLAVLQALEHGGTLVVDEFDTSLHSSLSGALIKLFNTPENNPYGAQLVFTSHDTNLLGRIHGHEVLASDEIWLTEKDSSGATSLYPVSSFESADEENRDRRYLVGRYGGVPHLDEAAFLEALRPRGPQARSPRDEETP
ncbi:ATP-binding protein [Nocardiopsis sp. HNM0947]|uniref:ATP-binding protein n=1 Tax=Nocardiopsis coralli TaxID=2772213 RepID=A0ABR9P553_9ACTN|nr:ATP-binding protein [Nocardiopsis coralli]MBE2998865.1 ATP-binding protein [Nocardiopsis coralli]